MPLADFLGAGDEHRHAQTVAFCELGVGVYIYFRIAEVIPRPQQFKRENEVVAKRTTAPHHYLQGGT